MMALQESNQVANCAFSLSAIGRAIAFSTGMPRLALGGAQTDMALLKCLAFATHVMRAIPEWLVDRSSLLAWARAEGLATPIDWERSGHKVARKCSLTSARRHGRHWGELVVRAASWRPHDRPDGAPKS